MNIEKLFNQHAKQLEKLQEAKQDNLTPQEHHLYQPNIDKQGTRKNKQTSTPFQPIDLERLKADLNAQAETIATHYLNKELGHPKYKNGQLRYGKTNRFSVTIRGHREGFWYDHKNKVGGDMFKLIEHVTGKDFKVSLKEALDFLGGKSRYQSEETAEQIALREKRAQEALRIAKQEEAKKQAHIQEIIKGVQPIRGTLAERYLREHRGIMHELNSDNLQFHPSLKNWSNGQTYPALVILSHDSDNHLCGVQATFLNPSTANKATIEGAVKLSRGSISFGTIVHHAVSDNPTKPNVIAFAEGSETALSVAEAHPDWEVRLTFGVSNFEKAITACYANNKDATFVICADNDGLDSGTDKAVKKAMANLAEIGIIAHVVEPTKPQGIEKWDFNDQLKQNGVDAVRQDLNKLSLNLTSPSPTIETMSKEPKLSINHSKLADMPVRTAWKKDFPDVIVHTSVKDRNQHPDYSLAKNGDREAAYRLIMDILTPESLKNIQEKLGDKKPIVVSVMAQEKEGKNVIPEAFAHVLSKELGLEVDSEIIQSNYVNHTKNSAFHRMAYPATFEGEVQKGRNYLIVDDHVGLGGTLANIKGHIEKNGGSVILTTTLTASHNSQYLAPSPDQIQGIKEKYGSELSEFLIKETGHDIEQLTRAESGQILATKDFNEIRERFVKARENSDARLLRETSERRQDQDHSASLAQPLTPEKEAEYKQYLKHYQSLRKLSEKTMKESDRSELRLYAHKLTEQDKSLVRYAKENYPLVANNILKFSKEHRALENLTPEKETKYKNHLKRYKSLKASAERSHDSNDRAALIEFSNRLTSGKVFMQYTHKHYPKICQNIQNFSAEYLTQSKSQDQYQEPDIER